MNLNDLYQRPGFLLRRTHQISTAVFENACATLKLTPAQYGVLRVLEQEPDLDQTRLARALAFDKVTMMRICKGLEARGLIARRPSTVSRRQVAVALSAEGRQMLKRAQEPAEQAFRHLMSPLSAVQQRQLLSALAAITKGLGEEAKAPFVPLP
jgi:MarR family transcriptional regulator, lower aerobic nicotinate degradation pathway regulator